MLCHNQFGESADVIAVGVFGALGVILRAVDEAYDVGILLDGARLAEIGKNRPLVLACLRASVQLRQRDDRYVEFLGESLERARYGRHLLLAASQFHAGGVHQLEVVDHDKFHAAFTHKTPRFGAQFRNGEARCLVEIEWSAESQAYARIQTVPFIGSQLAAFDFLSFQIGDVGYKTLHKLDIGHLQGEYRHGDVIVYRHILGHGEYECRLTHGGARGDDDQVGVLPARSHLVQARVAGLQTGESGLGIGRSLDLFQGEIQDRVYLSHFPFEMCLRYIEEFSLRFLKKVVNIVALVESLRLDF